MKLFLGRLFSILIVAGSWLLLGARAVLDLVGYSTFPEDMKVALGRIDDLFVWLLGVPWWASWTFALISTAVLMFVSWPRHAVVSQASPAPSAPVTGKADRSLKAAASSKLVNVAIQSAEQRDYVPPEVTPRRIREFYEANTSAQAHELTKDFIGKWMRVTGPLGNVHPKNQYFQMVTFQRSDYPSEQRALHASDVYMYFSDDAQIQRISRLRISDVITVDGQIDSMDGVDVHLKNCELVDVVVPQLEAKREVATTTSQPTPKLAARSRKSPSK